MIIARLIGFGHGEVIVQPKIAEFVEIVTFPIFHSIHELSHRCLFRLEVGHFVDPCCDTLDRGITLLQFNTEKVLVLSGSVQDGLIEASA